MNCQDSREVSYYSVLVLSYCSGLWFVTSDENKKPHLVYMKHLNSG